MNKLTKNQIELTANLAFGMKGESGQGLFAFPVRNESGSVLQPAKLSQMCVGKDTRAGGVLARILAMPQADTTWVLVSVRSGGRPRKAEVEAAERIAACSRLIDVPLGAVILVRGPKAREVIWEHKENE